MASLDDILTTAKNFVTAVNQVSKTYAYISGQYKSALILDGGPATLVATGQGRLVRVSVIDASGSVVGTIYDCTDINNLTNEICTIPHASQMYEIGVPFLNGLVVAPGTSMQVVVVYSLA